MILHQDIKRLEQSIRATSQHFRINETFVEKDYWISLVLNRLARSEKVDKVVCPGKKRIRKSFQALKNIKT